MERTRKRRSEFDELLLLLLFGASKITRPYVANVYESFEGWQYRTGLNKRIDRCEARDLIRRERRANKIVCRLTKKGRCQAAGGVDLEQRWQRRWDGVWRQVLFDLPARPVRVRQELWRWLRAQRFGCLQRSVWVTPDPVPEVMAALRGFRENAAAFTVMEASPTRGVSNAAIVNGAWDFDEINERYETYKEVVRLSPGQLAEMMDSPSQMQLWFRQERSYWQSALEIDPLLPRSLWPRGYRGPSVWKLRQRTMTKVARSFLAT